MSTEQLNLGLLIATGFVALATLALAFATALMAKQTRRSAAATGQAVALQKREVEVVEKQLALAQQQFEAARNASRPRLLIRNDVNWMPDVADGTVVYVGGVEPAEKVEVWVKASIGLFFGRCPTVLPGTSCEFSARRASDAILKRLPFPEFTKAPVLQGIDDFWAGVTWQAPDGTGGSNRFKFHGGFRDENPEVLEAEDLPKLDGEGA